MTALDLARRLGLVPLLIGDAIRRLVSADRGLIGDDAALAAALRADGFTAGEVEAALFMAPPGARKRPWREVLALGSAPARQDIESAYRTLARERDPDTGGSHEAMAELNRARDEALAEISA